MNERVYNFSPGPAVLPVAVIERAQRELLCLPGVGASVMEISHRSKAFEAILAATKQRLVDLLGIPTNYSILFLQGGSSLQFTMLAMNLLRGASGPAQFALTGTWGIKAFEEAQREGKAEAVWDGKGDNYCATPGASELKFDPRAAYAYITSNETIQGVQFSDMPETGGAPLVCDASSDFLSRPVSVDKFGVLFACAQKNAGISGVTSVIIRNDLLERVPKGLSPMLDYRLQAKNDSLYNTPPTFAIYILNLVADWLHDEIGGLEKMDAINRQKAKLLYDALDAFPSFYTGHARPNCRSLMNVTFRLPSQELEQAFVKEAEGRRLMELKGHRSVGGIRASIYNAMPIEGVRMLAELMSTFAKRHA